jgi:hypothetical protein
MSILFRRVQPQLIDTLLRKNVDVSDMNDSIDEFRFFLVYRTRLVIETTLVHSRKLRIHTQMIFKRSRFVVVCCFVRS